MKTRIILLLSALLMVAAVDVSAQSWVKKIKDKAANTVKDKVEKKIDDAVSKGTDAVLDAKLPKKDGEDNDAKGKADADEEAEEGPQDTEAVYEQSDFVPGSVVLFEDNLQNEQMGEFPSKWDLVDGSTDVANMKGKKCIHFEPGTRIEPLMTNQNSYLPDYFTLEFDFWMNDPKTDLNNCYELEFQDADGHDVY
ncbi:MAG: hypothetical protein J5729_06555 [Bacteroidaceae bacterium]|nr:hypothetical protein [Bacteroidaceae bacterium]